MKIALVHDYLCGLGGSERVFLEICKAMPEADIFTLAYRPEKTLNGFKKFRIRTTFLNPLIGSMRLFRIFFPINIAAIRLLNFSGYDIVLSSSASVAKYICKRKAVHICYMYYPTRAIWEGEKFFGSGLSSRLKRLGLGLFRWLDYRVAQDIDHIISISETSRIAIQKYYGRESVVLNSPYDESVFYKCSDVCREGFFLIVSRLEVWKRVDIAIEAFSQNGLRLKVVGDGAEYERLASLASSNIEFVGPVGDPELVALYRSARAVVFTTRLEYGLIPIEAIACGAPVICIESGGVLETTTPYRSDVGPDDYSVNAIFFVEQSAEALNVAIDEFLKIEDRVKVHGDFDVSKFSSKNFRIGLRNVVSTVCST